MSMHILTHNLNNLDQKAIVGPKMILSKKSAWIKKYIGPKSIFKSKELFCKKNNIVVFEKFSNLNLFWTTQSVGPNKI